MSQKNTTLRISAETIHLDDGSTASGTITCTPGQPMEVALGATSSSADIVLDAKKHVALGRFDPHVHFREAAIPTPEEIEAHGPSGCDPQDVINAVKKANALYSAKIGSLAALKGGVSVVGAMGNTPWGPVGSYRHERTQKHYDEVGLIPIVVWPRMEPGAAAIDGHEGKDFGSTFGGSGLTGQARRDMFELWRGQAVSYHNDQARSDETLAAYKKRLQPDPVLLHHEYFDGDTVLACQSETMAIAREAGITSLLARHIPTGPALQQILDARKDAPYRLPAEVGLDYVYWCRERLLTQKRQTALINYRRPAHPSRADQLSLIETTLSAIRSGDSEVFFGSDHAPHAPEAKRFTPDGLPGSPGTRNIEHSLQHYHELVSNYGYSWSDIDRLAAINPAKHMAQFYKFPHPVGTLASGAMANLAIFEPDASYEVDEERLSKELQDPHYHSALAGESGLRGRNLFTVSNGRVWDTEKTPTPLN